MAVRWQVEETSSMQMKVDGAGEREEADTASVEKAKTPNERA